MRGLEARQFLYEQHDDFGSASVVENSQRTQKVETSDGNSWKYLDSRELSEAQIQITNSSYTAHVLEYEAVYERNPEMLALTWNDYLGFFIAAVKPNGGYKKVLEVGPGTGSDTERMLRKDGLSVYSVEKSEGMARRAAQWLNQSDGLVLKRGDILEELEEFVGQAFDGILMETALQHIPKSKMGFVLSRSIDSLKPEGVLLFRVRSGTGQVFMTKDEVGERYFQSYSEREINDIVKFVLDHPNQPKLLGRKNTPHKVEGRPGFESLAFRVPAMNFT